MGLMPHWWGALFLMKMAVGEEQDWPSWLQLPIPHVCPCHDVICSDAMQPWSSSWEAELREPPDLGLTLQNGELNHPLYKASSLKNLVIAMENRWIHMGFNFFDNYCFIVLQFVFTRCAGFIVLTTCRTFTIQRKVKSSLLIMLE